MATYDTPNPTRKMPRRNRKMPRSLHISLSIRRIGPRLSLYSKIMRRRKKMGREATAMMVRPARKRSSWGLGRDQRLILELRE